MDLYGVDVTVISVMLAVPDAAEASEWYRRALDATELWNLGSVIGLEIQGAPFFLAQPQNRWNTPSALHGTTARIELFVDDPDTLLNAAAAAGADYHDPVQNHQTLWGTHRQGGFTDPFGHFWLVGDESPLQRHP